CERRLLRRLPRLPLGRLRREIEPVSAADLMRFLFRWQHVQSGTQLHGRDGLLEVIGQLQGLELPARAWETQVLPARVARYDPADLDGLCLAGAVAWGRLETDPPAEEDAGPRRAKAPTRAAPLAFVLREDLAWLLAPSHGVGDLPSAARAVLAHLERHGASFLADIARATGLLPAAAEEALWTLVARGLVTGDGTAGLRTLLKPDTERRPRRLRAVRGARRDPRRALRRRTGRRAIRAPRGGGGAARGAAGRAGAGDRGGGRRGSAQPGRRPRARRAPLAHGARGDRLPRRRGGGNGRAG